MGGLEEGAKQRHWDENTPMEMVWKEAKERSAESKKIISFFPHKVNGPCPAAYNSSRRRKCGFV